MKTIRLRLGEFGALMAYVAAIAVAAVGAGGEANAQNITHQIRYEARIIPAQGLAEIEVRIEQSDGVVREVRATFDEDRYFGFSADGPFEIPEGELVWKPPAGGGTLRYRAKIDHLREPAEYDSRCTETWTLFRGEDLFPSFATSTRDPAFPAARFRLRAPPKWEIVTALSRRPSGSFNVPDRGRQMPRPQGWFLAGADIEVVEEEIEETTVTLAAPREQNARLRDMMALLRWTLPPLRSAADGAPTRLLVVGADDPMWRGGLSGPGSLYVHSDRPLIGRDSTSPLLHELVHVMTHARSIEDGDWIVEGLAELYSIEMLFRSGTIAEPTYEATLERLRRRGRNVSTVRVPEATGKVTARAVTLLYELDARIREQTDGEKSLDDVLASLRQADAQVTEASFVESVRVSTGFDPTPFLEERVH